MWKCLRVPFVLALPLSGCGARAEELPVPAELLAAIQAGTVRRDGLAVELIVSAADFGKLNGCFLCKT